MKAYTQAQAASAVRKLGWRTRSVKEFHQAVSAFQGGYNLGSWLKIDGDCGPATSSALARSIGNGGKASAHFRWSELDCTCGGAFAQCRRNLIRREQLRSLEKYRARVGGLNPVSGYRCPGRNAQVGSKPGSQHRLGTATDLPGQMSWRTLAGLHIFSGIGYKRSTGKVLHADVRHIFPRSNNGGSLNNPMVWVYA